MTNDYRAMCAELLEWAERTSSHYYKQADVIVRARALLDQPEFQSPAAGEVAELVRWLRREATEAETDGWPDCVVPLARAADLLQHQHPQPVPVSERLPGPENCDAEGRCWWFCPPDFMELRSHATAISAFVAGATHWLPANALPTPEATNV